MSDGPSPSGDRVEPLGAPADPVRPMGRLDAVATAEEAARVRRAVRTSGRVLAVLVAGFVLLLVLGAFLVPWLLRP